MLQVLLGVQYLPAGSFSQEDCLLLFQLARQLPCIAPGFLFREESRRQYFRIPECAMGRAPGMPCRCHLSFMAVRNDLVGIA
jgi:hypothetical protein